MQLSFVTILLTAVLTITFLVVRNGRTPSPTDLSQSVLLAKPPPPLASSVTLKVVTFNIHDLFVVSKHRPERMAAIARHLVALDPDIVGIQEAFISSDREVLLNGIAATRLQHHRYFPSASVGSGLLILSAYPINEHFFFRYTQGGYWYEVWRGDWWAGKGVALARIELPQGYVDFFDTHAHARYGTTRYDGIRLSQMQEFAAYINRAATHVSPIIVVGDLNCRDGEEQYAAAVDGAHLVRAMTIPSKIDQIFHVDDPRYTFETLDTIAIQEDFLVNGEPEELSDHNGYISIIRITPR